MKKRALIIPVAVTVILTACGSPVAGGKADPQGKAAAKSDPAATKVFDELSGLTGQARTDKLVAMAEKEG